MKNKKNLSNDVGNLLIGIAILIILYIYGPYLQAYIPVEPPQNVAQTFSITIPKIHAYSPIIPDIDPWHKSNYEQALKKGVAQAQGFSDFGQPGMTFLFAHSSLPPWEMTRTNTSFLRLGELKNGDQIIVNKYGHKYIYEVFQKQEVWPTDVTPLLAKTDQTELVLQTCTPLGTDWKRLLVYAKPIT